MICVYPGSFDPPTLGHEDFLRRAATMFDEVIFALLVNPAKSGCIPREERLRIMRKLAEPFPNVRVEAFQGLLGEFARSRNASVILRGIRSDAELTAELAPAQLTRKIYGAETLFLPASPELGPISSSIVREIALFGGDWRSFVPTAIREDVAVYLNSHC